MKITELFNSIKNESSTLGKKQLIKDNLSNVLKQIFIDTYDKNKKYYIKNIPELTKYGDLTIDDEYDTFHSTLMKLHYRDVTGNDAIKFLTKTLEHYTKDDQEILVNIVQRNLKIGVSIENFNAVCPVVSTFDVALAENLEKVKNVDPIDGTYFASQKLDGCVDYYSNIEFEDGRILPIGEVVKKTIFGNIKSYDEHTNKVVYKPIKSHYMGESNKKWYNIKLKNGNELKITDNDRVMTSEGWKYVKDLTLDDEIQID